MLMRDDKGVGQLQTMEIRQKAKATKNLPEYVEMFRENAKGNTNVRGQKWYNNGLKSFMLYVDDPRIESEHLSLGRIKRVI